ncbi:MAG: ankyrin repeat domain-containing protein [Nitrospinae bacterium]|nr:ankyrin repeat domain-containing protein [Nitrospinota bacterium]
MITRAGFFRVLLAGLCLWLAVVTGAPPAVAAGVSCDDWNTQAFFEGADANDIARCVKGGADPVSRSVFSGDAPLHNAAAYSTSPAVIEALVRAGANPNARNLYKRTTPLHAAAAFGKTPAIVGALVKAGAKVNARDKFKQTPLHAAARESGTPAVVQALLDAGANPNAINKSGKTPWDYAKGNAALRGTEVYERLKEARLR